MWCHLSKIFRTQLIQSHILCWILVHGRYSASNMTTVTQNTEIRLIENVTGYSNRRNSLLLRTPKRSGEKRSPHPPDPDPDRDPETVVFFPGDVQNFESIMKHHISNQKWKEWTFENTVNLLHKRFPNALVLVVTPSRRVDETFSCFENFLHVDIMGSPLNYDCHHAWEHLRLLVEAGERNADDDGVDGTCGDSKQTDDCNGKAGTGSGAPAESPLTLIGFSKGCTVLNQLMHELKDARSDPSLRAFINRIQALYWLDGGHAGATSTYVIEESVVKEIATLKATIHIHVTPYQVNDAGRPHIGEHYLLFVQHLRSHGAEVKVKVHFRDESRSLKRHFEVLKHF